MDVEIAELSSKERGRREEGGVKRRAAEIEPE